MYKHVTLHTCIHGFYLSIQLPFFIRININRLDFNRKNIIKSLTTEQILT